MIYCRLYFYVIVFLQVYKNVAFFRSEKYFGGHENLHSSHKRLQFAFRVCVCYVNSRFEIIGYRASYEKSRIARFPLDACEGGFCQISILRVLIYRFKRGCKISI